MRGLLESLRTIAWMEVQGKLPGPTSSTMSILRLHKSNLPLRLVLSFKYLKIIMRNPFMEESQSLPVLDSRDVADPAIVQTVREIEKTGQDQYKYMTERVIERTTPVFDPISKKSDDLVQPTTIKRSIENKTNHHIPKE